MQNLIVLMEPPKEAFIISSKGANMILNRFCIDEDAAFELSEVNYLKTSSKSGLWSDELKGKEYSF